MLNFLLGKKKGISKTSRKPELIISTKEETIEALDLSFDIQSLIKEALSVLNDASYIDTQELEDDYSSELCKNYKKNYKKIIDWIIDELENKECDKASKDCSLLSNIIEEISLKKEVKPNQMVSILNIFLDKTISQEDLKNVCLGNYTNTSGALGVKSILYQNNK